MRKEPLSETVGAKVSAAEKQRIRHSAEEHGYTTVGPFVRRVLLDFDQFPLFAVVLLETINSFGSAQFELMRRQLSGEPMTPEDVNEALEEAQRNSASMVADYIQQRRAAFTVNPERTAGEDDEDDIDPDIEDEL